MTVLTEFLKSKSGLALSAIVGAAALSGGPAVAEEGIAMERDTALCVARVDVLNEHFYSLTAVEPSADMTEMNRLEILRDMVTKALEDPRLTGDAELPVLTNPEAAVPETAAGVSEVFKSLNEDLGAVCKDASDVLFQEFADISTVAATGDITARQIVEDFMVITADAFIKNDSAVATYMVRLENLTQGMEMGAAK